MGQRLGVAGALRHAIRTHRRSVVVSTLAQASEKFLRAYHNEGYWDFDRNGERFALQAFADWSGGDPVHAWDVGANHGEWALAAHAVLPAATITAFEVVPPICADMAAALGDAGWIEVEAKGLSDRDGEIAVHWNPTLDTTSSIEPRHGHDFFEAGTQVVTGRTTTGDRYLATAGRASPDLVKIDTEGHEIAVLRGCAGLLGGSRPPAMIQFEYGTTYIPGRHTLQEAFDLLTPHGYRVGRLFPDHVAFSEYRYRDENFRMGNYIAVRDHALAAGLG